MFLEYKVFSVSFAKANHVPRFILLYICYYCYGLRFTALRSNFPAAVKIVCKTDNVSGMFFLCYHRTQNRFDIGNL